MGISVVVVWVRFFVLSVIFLTMRVFLWLVMVFLVVPEMVAWICLVSFPGGKILVSEVLMMLMLLILSFGVVFGGE
jgi:hypothetical protein